MKKLQRFFIVCCCLSFIVLFLPIQTEAASKDTTKPTLSVTGVKKEFTNKPVNLTVKAKDSSGIQSVKWAVGNQKEAYFKNKGTTISLKKETGTVTVKKNGTYTFYAKDKKGNSSIKIVTIKNIDLTAPKLKIEKSSEKPTNKSLTLKVNVTDDHSGLKELQYLSGKKTAKDFTKTTKALAVKEGKGTVTVKKNGTFTFLATDNVGNKVVQVIGVNNIDLTTPKLSANYTVMNQEAKVMVSVSDESKIKKVLYLKGTETDIKSTKWDNNAVAVSDNRAFSVTLPGTYSILAETTAGNRSIETLDIQLEMRGVWISYLEFLTYYNSNKNNLTKERFTDYFNQILDNCVEKNMNTVIVQVRPFGDALYKSKYFPWSYVLTGTQGEDPGFDPLEILIDSAHQRGLAVQAWINPYRVTSSASEIGKLSNDNQAKKWNLSKVSSQQRNVLTYQGKMYYNPAKQDVQNLVINGVKEIVSNYDIDGIHFDDYFYPALGKSYKTVFDAAEYNTYKKDCTTKGKASMSIVDWRRNNVSQLVKNVNSAIKAIKKDVVFGISPQANIDALYSETNNYVDVKKWLSSSEYIDYICPQVYWSFTHKTSPYGRIVDDWVKIRTSPTVNIYIGVAVYKAGASAASDVGKTDPEWVKDTYELSKQVEYGRDTGLIDGFLFYRYEQLMSKNKVTSKAVENLVNVLKD